MNTVDEKNVDPIHEMNRIAQSLLDINLWGFKESYRAIESSKLIFDSKWCRLNLIWDGWDYLGGNTISIRYGRQHAPNDKAIMIWNGEECHCWHDVNHALHFLDGRSVEDAVKMINSHPLLKPFFEEEYRKEFKRRQPEWLAKMHAAIWQNYGESFFELFDLRQPELWEQYRHFLKEFYDTKGRSSFIKPPLDKVC
ncbi:MAG: hypothetical protein LUP94_02860 [Candidatus Methanomethylicus sp.]|nr:hypothetical protein [Candidatus Methanomethylicus sp.]